MRSISINGVRAEYISVTDRGLQYGDGLFETIACVDGKLEFWEDHIRRLRQGATVMDIDYPTSAACLSDIKALLKDNVLQHKQGRYVIKILLTRGQGARGYQGPDSQKPSRIIMIGDWPEHADFVSTKAHLRFCEHTISINKDLSGVKHLNRLDNVMARSEWKNEYHEGLMSDMNGNIIEGTMSNVFGIRDGALFTPSLDYCGIKGIVREHVIDIAKAVNMPVNISNMSKDDVYTMHEIFITNSIIGIWPVSQIEDKNLKPGDKTEIFLKELEHRKITNAEAIT